MLELKFIKTMDFTFEDIKVLECEDIKTLMKKIKDNDVVIIENEEIIEYVNSSYIMYFG